MAALGSPGLYLLSVPETRGDELKRKMANGECRNGVFPHTFFFN